MRIIARLFFLILLTACDGSDEGSSLEDCDSSQQTCIVNLELSDTSIELDTFGYLTSIDRSSLKLEASQLPGRFADKKGLLFQNNYQQASSDVYAHIGRKITGLKPGGLYDIDYKAKIVSQNVADCFVLAIRYPLWFRGAASGRQLKIKETKDSPWWLSGENHYWAFDGDEPLEIDDLAYISPAALLTECSDNSITEWEEQNISYKKENEQKEYTAIANEKGELWVALLNESRYNSHYNTVYIENISIILQEL